MKIFAVLLLLLNVVYLGWVQWGSQLSVNTPSVLPRRPEFTQAREKLALLSERPAAAPSPAPRVETPVADAVTIDPSIERPADQSVAPPVEPSIEPPTPGAPWCAVAAGFQDSNNATTFLSAVTDLGGSAELQSSEEPVASTWWVHLPPFPSEEAAKPMLAELQAKQIDSFYIKTGNLAGAISLGVFSRRESAAVEQQRFAEMGYIVSIGEVFRMGTRFKVEIRLENSQIREQPEWASLEANLDTAELQEIACK